MSDQAQWQVAGNAFETYSPLSGHVAKVSDEIREALVGEVGDALMSYVAGDVLTFPIEAHLANAKTK